MPGVVEATAALTGDITGEQNVAAVDGAVDGEGALTATITGETALPVNLETEVSATAALSAGIVASTETGRRIIRAVDEGLARILINGKLFGAKESQDRLSQVRYDKMGTNYPLNGVPTASLELIETGVRLNYRERQIDEPKIVSYFPFDRRANGEMVLTDLVGTGSLEDHASLQSSAAKPGPSLGGSIDMSSVPAGEVAFTSDLHIVSPEWCLRVWVRLQSVTVGVKQTLARIRSGGTNLLDLFYNGSFRLRIRSGGVTYSVVVPPPAGFNSGDWVMVSAFRDGKFIGIALNDDNPLRMSVGLALDFRPAEALSFGVDLDGVMSSLAFIADGGEAYRAGLANSIDLTQLADIDIGTDVLITTDQEPYRDIAVRLRPVLHYTMDENGTIVNEAEEIILHDVSGNDRHGVSTHPTLASLTVKGGSAAGVGYRDAIGGVDLDDPIIITDALNGNNSAQISVHDPGGRFEDINVDFGFKRPNEVDGGGVLGLYANNLALNGSVSGVTKGIPIRVDTSRPNQTRFILMQGRGGDDALADGEGQWKHPDGLDEGTKVYNRNRIGSITFKSSNGNSNAILELTHPTVGEHAPVWLPTLEAERTAARIDAATEFRFRIIGNGRQLKLFSVGALGTFLIATANFDESWFPFELDDALIYERPNEVGEYIFFQSDSDNERSNAMAFLRFGPRTSIDWRFHELLDTPVRAGAAPRARISNDEQQAVLYRNDQVVDGAVTFTGWVYLQEVGDEDLVIAQRMNANGNGWQFGVDSARVPYLTYKRAGLAATTIMDATSLDNGFWHYLCARVSLSGLALYLDGALKVSQANASVAQPDTADIVFGASDGTCRFLLDELSIYDRALTDAEILELYEGRLGERIFSGYVTAPDLEVEQNIRKSSIECSGYADRLNRIKVYPDPDNLELIAPSKRQLGDIASDLIRFYAAGEGITTHGIRRVGEIEREVFPIQSIHECIDVLSKRHATDATPGSMAQVFGVDTWLDTFFRQRGSVFRYPFVITDDLIARASYSRDITVFGNVYYVTGGPDSVGQRQEERFFGDGVKREWDLRFPAREIFEVYLDNVLEAHQGEGALWEFIPEDFKLVRKDGEPAPAVGVELIIDYRFSYPTLGVARSEDSIARYGRFERSIEDETIDESELLRSRAQDHVLVHDDPATIIDVELIRGALTGRSYPIIREGMEVQCDLRKVNDSLRNVRALVDGQGQDTKDGLLVHNLSLKIRDHEDARQDYWKKQRTPVRTPAVRFQVGQADRADPGDVLFSGLGMPLALGGAGHVWERSKDWVNVAEHVIGRFDGSQLGGITARVFFMGAVKASTATDDTRAAEVRLWNLSLGVQVGSTARVVSTVGIGHVVTRVDLGASLYNYVLQVKCNSNCPRVSIWQAQIQAGNV